MNTEMRVIERLADGRFHSGTVLARDLGLSRAAVWKAVHRLADHGLDVHSVPGRGYRLSRPLELLERDAVLAELERPVAALLGELELHRQIDSTNRRLLERADAGAPGGLVCLADAQRQGRGRRGRHWVSPFGSGIYLSVLWRYPHGPEPLQGVSLAVGVVLAEALIALGATGIGLKWPNDLCCDRGKLGGILVESAGEAGGASLLVVGVGLNLRMPAAALASVDQPWADLEQQFGVPVPGRNRLAGQAVNRLLPLLADYPTHGLEPFLERWSALDTLAGRPVVLRIGERTVRGSSRGVDGSGALLLDIDGETRRFHGGEISVRPVG